MEQIKPEQLFNNLFSDVIKPISLVIGDKALKIAYKIFDESLKEHKEITKITKSGYNINFSFNPKLKDSAKTKILLEIFKKLKKTYIIELGEVSSKMIDFAITDYAKKIPLITH